MDILYKLNTILPFFPIIYYYVDLLQVLAGDERLGLRQGAGAYSDEPMDTIFVKHVREHGPASVAGLSTGDRIISVNGETVAGKSYAHVVQVIQQTQCHLYLLVVPMENDILQLVRILIYYNIWYNSLYIPTCILYIYYYDARTMH